MTEDEIDAYAKALAAERALADGTGDEDDIDYWMGRAQDETA